MHLVTIDLLGWLASGLVLATFSLKRMVPLRVVAIASNVAFLSYGLADHLIPIAALHGILLPINALRLFQLQRLIRRTRLAARGCGVSFSIEHLAHLLGTARFPKGALLIRKGDHADVMYVILSGQVRVVGTEVTMHTGEIVGEFGLFSPERRRTASVVCETDVEVGMLAEKQLWAFFFENPEFGAYLVKLIMARTLFKVQN